MKTYVVWQFGIVYRVRGGVVMCRPGTQFVARKKAIGRLQLQVVVFSERLQSNFVRTVRIPFDDRVETDHFVNGYCEQDTGY